MNGTPSGERKIEIFAPFSAAFDLTKLILFQPFDLAKWLVIGFAAFLSHLAGGGGGVNFNYRTPLRGGDWNWRFHSSTHDAIQSAATWPSWVVPLIVIGGLFGLAFVVLMLWIGSRGKFIFTDCIVRNRGRIVEPWHEFRREGNSYFVFRLLVLLAALLIAGTASIPIWLPFVLHGEVAQGAGLIVSIIVLAIIFIVAGSVIAIISSFMVAIMYRRRCRAMEAFKVAWAMIAAEPAAVILYVLFLLVLWIAFAMIACLTTCLTCCITALPYVGTVILLPFYVFFMSYLLLFVRQFGPEHDAWANVHTPAPATAEVATPSLESPLSTDTPPPSEPPLPPPVQT